jgi:hypothetical protein
MSDLFDTTQVRDEPEHWDALAQRVATTAARESRRGGFDWLANSRAGWVAASLLVAAVLTFIMLPAEDQAARSVVPEWARSLAPTDDVGKVIVLRDSPPAIGALLLDAEGRGAR